MNPDRISKPYPLVVVPLNDWQPVFLKVTIEKRDRTRNIFKYSCQKLSNEICLVFLLLFPSLIESWAAPFLLSFLAVFFAAVQNEKHAPVISSNSNNCLGIVCLKQKKKTEGLVGDSRLFLEPSLARSSARLKKLSDGRKKGNKKVFTRQESKF